ncbi:zinc-binding alcohol dehydrogenase family protein [Mesorhizobium sp. M4A.F.Ca.ET.050.02.1.1]|uniref:zinc-binding alcohol dehydrogenase family protein n=1 Tax=Mesorhizobium sp. M4A.F.Ca.ET.050.02.1.1 TaxID=2496754 RepID=UPI000FCADCEC|nr:zinc-binding alcohol dehydrogenase family protein [Mesorhizobium sp. M4A.F.Ca.ET.050.02.1.1]RUX52723.1 zinc-binding alcohol dehydrogenase family protein [Mesorhizobium sp. M4A.F.Ca.ET.050.02.1.1]TGP50788.1 zinc-binding alcohol dehydrogenase family protein [bacterium M00.F.Ca.ET.230.01.1.1]TGT53707.1 zinc-binding alcohol dehydrogenase family protein [Mesorhizobium sp. M00.F.Ca.ET.170.01.1.1]
MKAAVCLAPGKLVLRDLAWPALPPPGWALLSVSHVGICGTDYHIFEGKHPFLTYPRVMGHEFSGTVVAAGEGVGVATGQSVIVNPYLSCGRCIACRQDKPNCCVAIEVLGVHRDGAMCEQILVPAGNLYPTGGLSLGDAAAVEFLAIGAHAVRRSMPGKGKRALVIGAGPIGLGTALFARIAGQEVTILDVDRDRLEFVERDLGFAVVDGSIATSAELLRSRTAGEAFDIVFDATGNGASIRSAFGYVAHGGALVMVSVVKDEISFSDPEFHKREMTLIGTRNATRSDFDQVVASIRDDKIPIARLVTHRTTLAKSPHDIARWSREKAGLIKAVITVHDDA